MPIFRPATSRLIPALNAARRSSCRGAACLRPRAHLRGLCGVRKSSGYGIATMSRRLRSSRRWGETPCRTCSENPSLCHPYAIASLRARGAGRSASSLQPVSVISGLPRKPQEPAHPAGATSVRGLEIPYAREVLDYQPCGTLGPALCGAKTPPSQWHPEHRQRSGTFCGSRIAHFCIRSVKAHFGLASGDA